MIRGERLHGYVHPAIKRRLASKALQVLGMLPSISALVVFSIMVVSFIFALADTACLDVSGYAVM